MSLNFSEKEESGSRGKVVRDAGGWRREWELVNQQRGAGYQEGVSSPQDHTLRRQRVGSRGLLSVLTEPQGQEHRRGSFLTLPNASLPAPIRIAGASKIRVSQITTEVLEHINELSLKLKFFF